MSEKAENSISTAYVIHCAIGLFFMFGFGLIPPFGPITVLGMKVLGIFIGSIYMWSFLDILWPSLLGLVALTLSGYAPAARIMFDAFGDSVTVLVLFGMILFGAIQNAGVTEYISRWFLTRKIINGRPIVFSFIFIYCTYILAALSASILPSILFMWAILYGVLHDVGYKKGDKYTTLMVIGTYFGAMAGHGAKPFVATGLILTGSFTSVSGLETDYLNYMLFGFIMATLSVIIYCLLMKYLFKPDMSKIAAISTERFEKEKLPPMNLAQKILFVSLFAFLLLMLAPSVLPKTWTFVALLRTIGNTGIAILFVACLCLIHIDKKPIMNCKEVINRYVAWDVYFLVAMVMVISNALTAESTGITAFLTEILGPALGGRSPFVFAAILLTFAMVVTNFANNTVVGVMMMPVIYSFALQNGSNVAGVVTAVIFMLHYAIVTPAASIYSCVLHGNSEWVESKDVVKYTTVMMVFMLALFIVIGIPLSNWLF